jgi:hypothetical protein
MLRPIANAEWGIEKVARPVASWFGMLWLHQFSVEDILSLLAPEGFKPGLLAARDQVRAVVEWIPFDLQGRHLSGIGQSPGGVWFDISGEDDVPARLEYRCQMSDDPDIEQAMKGMTRLGPRIGKKDIDSLETGGMKVTGEENPGIAADKGHIGELTALDAFDQFAVSPEREFDPDTAPIRFVLRVPEQEIPVTGPDLENLAGNFGDFRRVEIDRPFGFEFERKCLLFGHSVFVCTFPNGNKRKLAALSRRSDRPFFETGSVRVRLMRKQEPVERPVRVRTILPDA